MFGLSLEACKEGGNPPHLLREGFLATLWYQGKMLSVRTSLVLSGENVSDSLPVAGENHTVTQAGFGAVMWSLLRSLVADWIVGASEGKKPVSPGCRN